MEFYFNVDLPDFSCPYHAKTIQKKNDVCEEGQEIIDTNEEKLD